ncbi:MAG: polysaccharide deacetylase [Deltaproteobacteria bacterium RBG_16_49_23]|nr:MAG: polysaccharide deacetylase [Deltaproteobacteria bacterium RBG_16_49_23]
MVKVLITILFTTLLFTFFPAGFLSAGGSPHVPILLYHRFGPAATDSMTVTTHTFEAHLKYLMTNGYRVIPVRELIDYYLGKRPPPHPKSVVITVDDGHKSVHTDMFPLIKKYHIPVTMFIYPSAISNASYAMTWGQLREMKETGLFDFQSHTFWHPNFKKEKTKLKPAEYESFVGMQLKKSKEKLEAELKDRVDMLAWPFGIYDDDLIHKAGKAGYMATFTMERNPATSSHNVRALPRYLMTNGETGKAFVIILSDSPRG